MGRLHISIYKNSNFNYEGNLIKSLKHHWCKINIKCNRCGLIWSDIIWKHKLNGCPKCDKKITKHSIGLRNKFKTDYEHMMESFESITLRNDNLETLFAEMEF